MAHEQWAAVDRYIADTLRLEDPVLAGVQAAAHAAGLPAIAIAANQGKLLMLLARACGARQILELGTLAGYSTIWLARALPDQGRLISLEANPRHAAVARANIEAAKLADKIELRLGPALDSLEQLHAARAGPFDLVFIDADKPNTARYVDWAVRLSRPGTLIIIDNVVRAGAIIDPHDRDADVNGIRELYATLADDPRLTATALQTVGEKGYDGLAIALVTSPELSPAGSLTAASSPLPSA
jgi:predicted O-methyltransferase YrrM